MRNVLILIIAATMLLSSCATILNGRYQKIVINTNESDLILINGDTAKPVDGKYLMKRDLEPKQITVKSKGFKDENIVIMQYKTSPWMIMSIVPFIVLVLPPLYDQGRKAYNYDKKEITYQKQAEIQKKTTDSKEIKINKVSVELEKENIKYRYFNHYKNYILNRDTKVAASNDSKEKIIIGSTMFSDVLNKILKNKGYIDTTSKVLKNSYIDNLQINAKVKDYTIHHIRHHALYDTYGGMVYIDLSIEWEVLDYYDKSIYSETITSKSGEFAIIDYKNKDKVINSTLHDVMEISFTKFMKSEKVDSLLHDRSEIEKEKDKKEINIPKSKLYVSDLSQSIKSALTIKSKNGFGSGFIISDNGYIITNYHVVSDTSDLKVVLHDESEHKVKIIRASKIYDLALLKINAEELVPYKIDLSKEVQIASEIYAVGTPSAEDLSQTISRGIVSGVRNKNDSKLIQTDASINSGNSGGPLINKKAEVIGVVSSKMKGFGVEGIAFGIPAYEILDRLKIKISDIK